jgi:hypothetical protein
MSTNLLAFNIKNIKTNNVFIQDKINQIDVCYLTELWLHSGEQYILDTMFCNNYNIHFQSDMSIADSYKKGRPFGGKCWLIKKDLKINKCEFINQQISYVNISTAQDSSIIIIGVYLQFDNNTTERFNEFISNLQLISTIIEDNNDKPVYIMGDFNADLERNKRFDNELRKFIDNGLTALEYQYPQNTNITYYNEDYSSHIDHCLSNEIGAKSTIKCKIIKDETNTSDHNPILTTIAILKTDVELNNKTKRFHQFNWQDNDFLNTYNEYVLRLTNDITLTTNENDNAEDIKTKTTDTLKQLTKALLKAARKAEIALNKKHNQMKKKSPKHYHAIKQTWCQELVNVHVKMVEWHKKYKENKNDELAKSEWKRLKCLYKSMQKKKLMENSNNEVYKLEKHLSLNKMQFWSKVSKWKKRQQPSNNGVNINLEKFRQYYANIFSHDNKPSNNIHEEITVKVNEKLTDIKDNIYDIRINSGDIMELAKTFKNNKACGIDFVSGEMLKHNINMKVFELLAEAYTNILKYGFQIDKFNITVITPIPKKGKISDNPFDFRPISVSNTFCQLFEKILLKKTEHIFKFNTCQFGYKPKTSCKHASFVVNEVLHHYKKFKSPCYTTALDFSKAFDRMWRDGLFHKLNGKIDDCYWRALVVYYRGSIGIIKANNSTSKEFEIKEGVKQGGILSPFLFNYFINDLLEKCQQTNMGAKIGNKIMCIIGYCDDIIIMSPVANQMNKLLQICQEYADCWKLEFNVDKCNWLVFGEEIIQNVEISLNGQRLKKVNFLDHLGLPVGNTSEMESRFKEKFKKVERSYYSLYELGCRPNGLSPSVCAQIYNRYCQSIFYYGLEIAALNKKTIKSLNIRQNILLKNSFGLSKFSRSSALLEAINIKTIEHIYYKHKIGFMDQLRNNELTSYVYDYISNLDHASVSKYSYIYAIRKVGTMLNLNYTQFNSKQWQSSLNQHYKHENNGLVDSISWCLKNTNCTDFNRRIFYSNLLKHLTFVHF